MGSHDKLNNYCEWHKIQDACVYTSMVTIVCVKVPDCSMQCTNSETGFKARCTYVGFTCA